MGEEKSEQDSRRKGSKLSWPVLVTKRGGRLGEKQKTQAGGDGGKEVGVFTEGMNRKIDLRGDQGQKGKGEGKKEDSSPRCIEGTAV